MLLRLSFLFIAGLGVVFSAEVFAAREKARITCATAKCHSDLTGEELKGSAKVHGPLQAQGCTVCHLVDAKGSRPTEKHLPLLRNGNAEINQSCLICHDEFVERLKNDRSVHPAIPDESCVSCHDPHKSNRDRLLKKKPQSDLCFTCHKNIKNQIAQAQFKHGAMDKEKGCLGCHFPHTSKEPVLLRNDERTLCLDCHDAILKPGHIEKHKGADLNTCLNCHAPHAAPKSWLLRDKPQGQSGGAAK